MLLRSIIDADTGGTAGPPQRPSLALGFRQREPLCALLNLALANALDLKSRVMQARWQARHRGEGPLVAIYDDLNDDLDFLTDDLGQRIVFIGGEVIELAGIPRASRLPPQPRRGQGTGEQAEAVRAALAEVGRHIGRALDAALGEGDLGTADVLTRLRRRTIRARERLAVQVFRLPETR